MSIKDEILEKTDRGLEVFCFYMPVDFVPKKNFRNPLYDDTRASCNIYFDARCQCYRMKDFGNEAYSGDCFWFAAAMLGLDVRKDFMKVLSRIIHDLQLNIALTQKHEGGVTPVRDVSRENETRQKERASMTEEGRKWFSKVGHPFTREELSYWMRYGIGLNTLRKFNVESLSSFESVSGQGKRYRILSSISEPMFCYVMGDFVKIYRPLSKLRFLYGGRKVKDYVFGFEQLPNKGDIMFITGGEKDVLSLSAHGFNAVCFNSETAQLPESIIEGLSLRFRHLILLYDTDETGLRESQRQAGCQSMAWSD